jgi:hypothetical protein
VLRFSSRRNLSITKNALSFFYGGLTMTKQTAVAFDFSQLVIVCVEEMFKQLLDARHHRYIPEMLVAIQRSSHVGPYAKRPYRKLSKQEREEVDREVSMAVQTCEGNDGPITEAQVATAMAVLKASGNMSVPFPKRH